MITEEFERGETIVSEKVMTPEVRVLFLVASYHLSEALTPPFCEISYIICSIIILSSLKPCIVYSLKP